MRTGGSYRREKGKKPKLIHRTKEHPGGNKARPAEEAPAPEPARAKDATGAAKTARPARSKE